MPADSSPSLDLSSVPPIYILPTHLQTDDLHDAEDSIYHAGGVLTYHASEARVFLGRIGQKKRAAFDLRARGVWTEEATLPQLKAKETVGEPARKRRRIDHSVAVGSSKARRTSPESKTESSDSLEGEEDNVKSTAAHSVTSWPDMKHHVLVLKLDWLDTCIKKNKVMPHQPYTIYTGKIIPKPPGEISPKALPSSTVTYIKAKPQPVSSQPARYAVTPTTILSRAQAETPTQSSHSIQKRHFHRTTSPTPTHAHQPPKLHRTTTSEHESLADHPLPPLPAWATHPNAQYSCLRSTPLHCPNADFIVQLSEIKAARLLTLDPIGVRAYSTAIASIAAYPHVITHPDEITRLPGCSEKIATLWTEWISSASSLSSSFLNSSQSDPTRTIKIVEDLKSDPDLLVLRQFWEIWGVGPETARRFYFESGWRDLDDVVEFGWKTLSRVQQIGVKFYDEFLLKIPRQEVEAIAAVIHRHARLVRDIPQSAWGTDADMECVIVGGYRRGKTESGDVDVILSHREENFTRDLVVDVVRSLESEAWITHTLSLHTTNSDRGQQTLPFRTEHGHGGHGFDTLDKALCVWQDPNFDDDDDSEDVGAKDDTTGEGGTNKKHKKNPNLHRRVDIIISPWRTVGCAILGWSGATTFQRDIRRFVSKTRGWKFDSSGVRDRGSGQVLDLESPRMPGAGKEDWEVRDGWLDREKRLMEAMGIGWRPGTERCTY